MNLKKLSPWIAGLLAVVAIGIAAFTSLGGHDKPTATKLPDKPNVSINQHQIGVEIADEESERVIGLSERDSLPKDRGMLFIFDTPDYYGIWMKGMRFDLDIIWLDENYRIITIVSGLKPESYPQVVQPDKPAKYVLEVNARVAVEYGWSTGQTATLHLR